METINDTHFTFAPVPGRVPFPGHSMSLMVKASFHLSHASGVVPLPDQISPTGDEFYPGDEDGNGSLYYASDFVHFKPRADLMLTGHCHTPHGKPATICPVEFRVGDFDKSLVLIGDRQWNKKGSLKAFTEPGHFTAMPLKFENSFGGNGFRKNPVGRGWCGKEDMREDAAKQFLPNIEDKNNLITSRQSSPEPQGFGPLNALWQERARFLGTYDDNWEENRWPWFPEDFNWAYCNQALADQQLDGYLRGDELLYFKHMHPDHPEFRSQLPGVRVRCFVQKFADESNEPEFKEIPMNLDTLWVDMDSQTLVLAWRGWTRVISSEFEEMEYLYIMSEAVDEQDHNLNHYHEKFLKALETDQQKWGMVPEVPTENDEPKPAKEREDALPVEEPEPQLEGAELIEPSGAIEPGTEKPFNLKRHLQAQSAALMAQMGINLESLDPATRQEVESQQETLLNKLTETDPVKIEATELENLEQQKKQALDQLGIDPDNLPDLSAKAKQEQGRMMMALGMDESQIAAIAEDPAMGEFWGIMGAAMAKMELDPENMEPMIEQAKKLNLKPEKDEESPPKPERILEPVKTYPAMEDKEPLKEIPLTRERVQARALNKESFMNEDFRSLDLSDLDLSGLNFAHADFSGVTLANTNLSGANLSSAILSGANLSGASLPKADLTEALLKDAILGTADFSEAAMEKADLTNAQLDDAIFEEAVMSKATLKGCKAKDTWFTKADLTQADFSDGDLSGADFSKALLDGAKFKNTTLTEANIEGVVCKGADFSVANLTELRASEGSDFTGSCFSQVQGHESVWRGAILNDTDFTFSNLDGANFRDARLIAADLTASSMKFARFIKADLTRAKLIQANLFQASLEQANLDATDLRGANLYGVEFLDANMRNTLVAKANLTMTKLAEN